ncbi:hypothetical protein JG687_00002914 [Phytophthora cactorum]|uniref:Autophagy-related protein 101 n=2 Tax=Phytophthora cactorum TaxID=29920 RepID=A0A8T1UX39_9STRA|nr:hypothetical protein JG687_00002914 [Phytophthora cactorum]
MEEVVGDAEFGSFPGERFRFSVGRVGGVGYIRLEHQVSKRSWTCEVTDVGAFAPEGVMLPPNTVLQYVATSLKESTGDKGPHLTRDDTDNTLQLEVLVKLDLAWAPKYVFPLKIKAQQAVSSSDPIKALTTQVQELQQQVKTLKEQMKMSENSAMLGTTGIASSSVGSGVNAVAAASWKEHRLDEIPVAAEDVGDAVTCLLHTILFTRAPGPVRPSEATCHAFPNITYALCAVGDVSRKVDHAVRSFEEAAVLGGSSYVMGASSGMMPGYGQPSIKSLGTSNVRGANSGYIAVTFFERKVKKALFGLMSNEEKMVFEKWILPVTVTSSPAASQEERELCAGETEAALQNALLHILTAVQSIEHIPVAMYDFEITTFNSLEDAQVGSSYGGGLGSGSVRLMP